MRLGRPFVGRAGKLLDELLAEAGLVRSDVWITNVVKARPPNNRDPKAPEIAHWMPWLARELELIRPRLVVPLGRHALKHFAPEGEDRRGPRAAAGTEPVCSTTRGQAIYNVALRETLFADARALGAHLR